MRSSLIAASMCLVIQPSIAAVRYWIGHYQCDRPWSLHRWGDHSRI